MIKTIKKYEINWYISIGLLSIVLFYIFRKFWLWDIKVPLDYHGDVVGLLQQIKNILRGDSLSNLTGIAAPFGSDRSANLFDGSLHYFIMYIIAKLTRNLGATINIYFILTFSASSICCYYVTRKLNISKIASFIVGIAYSFIPGHILRSQSHLYIGSSYIIPLGCLTVIYLFRGHICASEYYNNKKLNMIQTLKSVNSKKMWFSIITLSLLTFSSLYYGVFIAIILFFSCLYISIDKKQWRHFFYMIVMYISIGISTILIFMPQIIFKINNPNFNNSTILTRTMSDVETYGLKLAHLLLPVMNHRIPSFSNLTNLYNTNFSPINESNMANLGLLLSIGFVIGSLSVFFKLFRKSTDEIINELGKLNLFIFILSVVGGFASFIGMIYYGIRCFNRYSFFIGVFCAIIAGFMIDKIFNKISLIMDKYHKHKYIKLIKVILSILLIITIMYDQVPATAVITKESSDAVRNEYYNDASFVSAIEEYEKEEAMVLVLPISYGFSGNTGITSTGNPSSYEEYKMYFHSKTSKWSPDAVVGEKTDKWLENLQMQSTENILKISSIIGFSGIAIYHTPYNEDEFKIINSELRQNLGEPVIENRNGNWSYYTLNSYSATEKKKYTSTELKTLKDIFETTEVIGSFPIKHSSLYGGIDTKMGRKIQPEDVQYGPYYNLSEGDYTVVVEGSGLLDVTFDCFTSDGNVNIDKVIEKSSEIIIYKLKLNEQKYGTEFRVFNNTDHSIYINNVYFFKDLGQNNDLVYNKFLNFNYLLYN